MIRFLTKPYRWSIILTILLIISFTFVLLDTFVIPKSISPVTSKSALTTKPQTEAKANAITTDHSYQDNNIEITIETLRKYDTTIYVANIKLSSASYLKTALAEGTYGRNIKETTSKIAKENNAIFAVNGDYYGFRDDGYVLRNGVTYRSNARDSENDEALVINSSGDFSIDQENQESMKSLTNKDAWQILSFGPSLVEDGQVTVNSSSEVSKAMTSNPRTAIGQISKLHYVVIVSDGRTNESKGLSLLELGQEFAERGCTTAYNLDGGGSSTLYFNGKIINNPTDGRRVQEREVSDIVYFGY